MALSAGRLRGRVRIEEPAGLVDNGRGGRRAAAGGAWKVLDESVPAEIVALRGDEALEAAVVRSKQLWRVTIRRRPILTGWRLVWTDPVLGLVIGNIRAAALTTGNDGVIITAESEGQPA